MIIFVTGGMGSGKSSFALKFAEDISKRKNISKKIFLATAQPIDEEMKQKIKKHKDERKNLNWETVEEYENIHKYIKGKDKIILIDSLTTWLGNLFHYYGNSQAKIKKKVKELISALKRFKGVILIVSDQVNWGVIPFEKSTRMWLRTLSSVNEEIAKTSSEVYLLVSGIPVRMK